VSTHAKNHYDIIIAGGGMIGTSLALALAPLKLRVAVVERIPRAAAAQPSFDDRSTALSRSSQRLFEALGLWQAIVPAATPITKLHVSDQGRFGFSHIDASEEGVEALGYVVINRLLGTVLQEAMQQVPRLDVHCPAEVAAARAGAERVSVELADGLELTANLLVVADGARSAVRGMLGIEASQASYEQRGIVGNLLPERSLDNRAFERFTEQGPLAILPIADGRAGFVWTVAEQDAERVLGLDDEGFLAEIQAAFGYRLGTFSRVGTRDSYPLLLSRALRLTAPRAVLVGNAAHGLHPAAAQGFNLGLRDVAALCDCIAEAAGDPGAPHVLTRYAEWRRNDQRKLVGFTDGLVRLFGSSLPPVRVLRDLGMLGFDLVPGVRSVFARHTMGLAGFLPRLSRGVPIR
jgi:2-octaprenyl-6-methoxyphenol hydroxylase